MKTYIAFLRGINVSGQRKIKMATLRESIEKIGFKNVQTYIQSGNIVFISKEDSKAVIREQLENCIENNFGFDIPVLVLEKEVVSDILKKYPFKHAEDKNQYFALLYSTASETLVNTFNKLKFKTEDYLITERCVYLNCKAGAGKAKLNNNLIEKKLEVIATTRNLRTMQQMLELAN